MNSNLKPGDFVIMKNCAEADIYGDRVWVVSSEPWALVHGEKIVRLEGYRGGFAIECLKQVDEIDHKYTENIVCPHCGYEDTDSYEWERDAIEVHNAVIECEDCGKKFSCSREFEITYTTEKYEANNEN